MHDKIMFGGYFRHKVKTEVEKKLPSRETQEAKRCELSDDILFLAKPPSECFLGIGYIVR